jgi:hypothetical protein
MGTLLQDVLLVGYPIIIKAYRPCNMRGQKKTTFFKSHSLTVVPPSLLAFQELERRLL